jgi:hypothetical protein
MSTDERMHISIHACTHITHAHVLGRHTKICALPSAHTHICVAQISIQMYLVSTQPHPNKYPYVHINLFLCRALRRLWVEWCVHSPWRCPSTSSGLGEELQDDDWLLDDDDRLLTDSHTRTLQCTHTHVYPRP